MSCLAIAAAILRVASPEPGGFIESDCGVQVGVAERDGRAAGEIAWRVDVVRPFYVRASVQAWRPRAPEPVIIAHGPGIHTQDYSIEAVPFGELEGGDGGGGGGWKLRPRVAVGVAVPIRGRLSIIGEVEPFTGAVHAGVKISL